MRRTTTFITIALLSATLTARADDVAIDHPPRHHRSTPGLVTGIALTSFSGASVIAGTTLVVFQSLGPQAYMLFAAVNCYLAAVGTGVPGVLLLANNLGVSPGVGNGENAAIPFISAPVLHMSF